VTYAAGSRPLFITGPLVNLADEETFYNGNTAPWQTLSISGGYYGVSGLAENFIESGYKAEGAYQTNPRIQLVVERFDCI